MMQDREDLLAQLRALLGPAGVLEGAEAADKAHGWSRMGTPLAVLRPADTAEVSAVLRLCHEAGQAVVPWGGKTGLVEGGNADGALALSLERMTRVLEIDRVAATMTVEAGCPLQAVCEAADAEGLLFPLDLGSRGSATIGGNIATNAGGNRVIRYGMMRDMVLGLEAVLADGTVVSSLNHLIKNNAGYDLKQLFIGSEGTLGHRHQGCAAAASQTRQPEHGLPGGRGVRPSARAAAPCGEAGSAARSRPSR